MFNASIQKIRNFSLFSLLNRKGAFRALFLLFCVATSKGIIIYNEEILVFLTFWLFVLFSQSYFGNTIKESLDERSSTIKDGLENFHRLKEEALQELLYFYKQSLQVKKLFPLIKKDCQNQVSYTSLAVLAYPDFGTKRKTTRSLANSKQSRSKKVRKSNNKLNRNKIISYGAMSCLWRDEQQIESKFNRRKARITNALSVQLYNRFSNRIKEKLSVFQSSKSLLSQRVQNFIARAVKDCVLIKKRNQKKSTPTLGKSIKITPTKSVSQQVKQALKSFSSL